MPLKPSKWEKQVDHWIKTQHGTAGWEQKLENFIQSILSRQLNEVALKVGALANWDDETERGKMVDDVLQIIKEMRGEL